MTDLPLTVIIPAYNAADSIVTAVASARSAGARQILVVDDGSVDATSSVARDAGATVIRQQNAGAAHARRKAIPHIEQEFVIFLDADDSLVATGVGKSVEFLISHPAYCVCAGTIITSGPAGQRPQPQRYSPIDTRSLLIKGFGPWPPAAAVVRTSSLHAAAELAVQPLHPRFAEDYELLIRLSLVGSVHNHGGPTCVYALSGGKSARNAAQAIEAKEQIRSHYAEYAGIEIALMSPRAIKRSSQARQLRAAIAERAYLRVALLSVSWCARNPIDVLRRVSLRLRRPRRTP